MKKGLLSKLVCVMVVVLFCAEGLYAQVKNPMFIEKTEETVTEEAGMLIQKIPVQKAAPAGSIMQHEAMTEVEVIVEEVIKEKVYTQEQVVQEKATQQTPPVYSKPKPKDIHEEMGNMITQLDLMGEKADSLAKLGKKKDADQEEIKIGYEEFVAEIKHTKAQAEILSKTSQHIRSQGELYFADWLQKLEAIKKLTLRKRGMKNRDKEERTFNQFADETKKTEEALENLINDVKDVSRYLEFDLTSSNISSASKELRGIKNDIKKIQRYINMMGKKLNSLSTFSNIINR